MEIKPIDVTINGIDEARKLIKEWSDKVVSKEELKKVVDELEGMITHRLHPEDNAYDSGVRESIKKLNKLLKGEWWKIK